MATDKRTENIRNYKLRADRCQHGIDAIAEEYLDTGRAATDWEKVVTAARSRLERLKAELLQSVQDRRTPGVIQSTLQRTIYACLTELSRPAFVDRTLKPRKRGRA